MKRLFLFLLLFLLVIQSAFSLTLDFSVKQPDISTTAKLSVSMPKQISETQLKENIGILLDFDTLKSCFYIGNQKDNLDLLLNVVYAPKIGICNIGITSYFHNEFFYDVYTNIDFFTGLYCFAQFNNLFSLKTEIMYLNLNSKIFNVEKTIPWLKNNSFALNLDFNFNILPLFNCGFKISSFNEYKVNSFFTPFWTIYTKFNLSEKLSCGAEVEFLYIDMFTLSANLKTVSISSFVKWDFK